VIDTERLRLVRMTAEEAESILAGHRSECYADGYPSDGTLVAAAIVLKSGDELGPWTMYQARTREGDRVVAGLGFIDPPDAEGRVRVGFSETAEAQAEGYAAEALAALIAFAHERGAKVVADTADARVAEVFSDAGMSPVGICGGLRQFEG
jgi:RimJ/RimL family protein N-acetyltransferase